MKVAEDLQKKLQSELDKFKSTQKGKVSHVHRIYHT